jgi:5-(carboxyamino)imidazole ribonucleotide mutase
LSPRVGILVGSESDLPVLEKCTARLEQYGVEYELQVRSAHRNPEGVSEYAEAARGRGLKSLAG